MGFFNDILSKIGLGGDEKTPAEVTKPKKRKVFQPLANEPGLELPEKPESAQVEPESVETVQEPAKEQVDVGAILEALAAKNPQKLNWRTSIVDLLKLLDLDSSYRARKELAKELNCPEEIMSASAKMNMWLHKTVIAQIAENGGKLPEDLLD
ncbi:MAG: oxidoreductase [Acidobacteria bacterium]|nr:MAG: oxidoreductase [Acidobacteriota bacterium]